MTKKLSLKALGALLAGVLVLGIATTYFVSQVKAQLSGEGVYIQNVENFNVTYEGSGAVLGGVSQDHYNREYFHSGLQQGSDATYYSTSSTATSYTLTADELCGDTDTINWTVNVNTTLTIPATTDTTWSCVFPGGIGAGKSREYRFINASTTAGATATFAAGTLIELNEDQGQDLIVNGAEVARLTFFATSTAANGLYAWLEVGQTD